MSAAKIPSSSPAARSTTSERFFGERSVLPGLVGPVLKPVDERLPGGLDDVLADPDRAPDALAVGRVYENAGGGGGRPVLVEDADLVVGEVYLLQLRVVGLYSLSQCPIEGIDGPVALGGRDLTLPLDEELYRRLDRRLAVSPLLGDYAETLQLEERLRLAGRPSDEERERGVRGLVVVAFVLPLLYGGEDRGHVASLQAQLIGFGPDRILPRELPDRRAPDVAHRHRRDVLVGPRVLGYPVHVQSALVGEGAPADVGAVRVGGQVHELGDVIGDLREPLTTFVVYHLQAHFELQVGDGGAQIAVAAPLAHAVYGPLHVRRPRLDRGKGVRHPAARVVVGVDPDLHLRELARRASDDGLELRRERPTVGVAEDEGRGPGLRGDPQHRQRVIRVVAEAVEVVLGVEDDFLARPGEVGDRVPHGLEVLLRRRAQDLLDV